MQPPEATNRLVFTDLDGTLLDHDDYGYRDALPLLEELEQRGIPVVFVSSKTRAEIEQLRGELGNRHPFVVENGAAAFVPKGYFGASPPGTVERDGYHVIEWCPPRQRWLDELAALEAEYGDEFDSFSRAGVEGVQRMTGLEGEAAARACAREYSEPVLWLGTPEREQDFVTRLRGRGAEVLRGGRFFSVGGKSDKGRAVVWLRDQYRAARAGEVEDLAAGDSANDVAMLEEAGTALLVRSPAHDFPSLGREGGVIRSTRCGPAGWAEGVARWLQQLNEAQEG